MTWRTLSRSDTTVSGRDGSSSHNNVIDFFRAYKGSSVSVAVDNVCKVRRPVKYHHWMPPTILTPPPNKQLAPWPGLWLQPGKWFHFEWSPSGVINRTIEGGEGVDSGQRENRITPDTRPTNIYMYIHIVSSEKKIIQLINLPLSTTQTFF